MSHLLYSILGVIVILISFLVALYNLISHRCGKEEEDDFDLLAEVITDADDDCSQASWRDFQGNHIITEMEFPGHSSWDANRWNEFIKKQDIGVEEGKAHSVISVDVDWDVISDFNPLKNSLKEENPYSPKSAVYRSQNPRAIYHFMMAKDSKSKSCKVYRHKSSYTASLRAVSVCPYIVSDSRLSDPNKILWVPVALRRMNTSTLKFLKRIS